MNGGETGLKDQKIASHLEALGFQGTEEHPVEFLAYFHHFNRGEYYEAHDVLEHLWLRTTDGERDFFKGLIQFAGAFVHLRLHYLAPNHPKHGRRLAPAARLFALATRHLKAYGPGRRGLDLNVVLHLATQWSEKLVGPEEIWNPWSPDAAPQLVLSRNEPH